MPLRSQATTASFEDTELAKANARSFTVQLANQPVLYQLNVAPYGRGEVWMPLGGIELRPGYWNFDAADWQEFGVEVVQGIRFAAVDPADPGVITVS